MLLTRNRYILPFFQALMVYLALLPVGSASATTLGDVILGGARSSLVTTPVLLNYLAYIIGFGLFVVGILKLRAHTSDPDRAPLSHAVWYIVGATLLISLPWTIDALRATYDLYVTGATKNATTVALSTSGSGLDKMMARFVQNVRGPMQFLIWALGAVLGMFFMITALVRMARGAAQDGPRGSLGSGTLMRLIIGSILFSTAATSDIFATSLFGGNVYKFTGLSITGIPAASLTQATQAVAAILIFIQIIGFMAFMRGFLMLRALADGNNGVSTGAAFTHILGGALAINISSTLRALEYTFCGGSCGIASYAL
jgi:hypothetical protein